MLKEIGEYKNQLRSIFVNNDNICKLLLGEDYKNKFDDLDSELDKYIIRHPYIPDTITTQNSYIMLETYTPKAYGKIKTMKIVVQAVCHKGIAEYKEKPEGYSGLRYDVLAELIEELLCPEDVSERKKITKMFGIGAPDLESVDIFLDKEIIGRTLTFIVPDFR